MDQDSFRASSWFQAAVLHQDYALSAFTLGLLLENHELAIEDLTQYGSSSRSKRSSSTRKAQIDVSKSSVPPGAEATAAAAFWFVIAFTREIDKMLILNYLFFRHL